MGLHEAKHAAIKTAFFTGAEKASFFFTFFYSEKILESKKKGEKGREEKKEVIEKTESQKQRGGGIVWINTVSSQCRVSFQAFVAAPTMKCVCPQKPYTHSGGFPDLREKEEEKEQEREGSGQCSLSGRPARAEGEPGNMPYSPGCTHSEALASAAKSG